MDKAVIEKAVPFLMDGMYVLSLLLSMLGLRLVPFIVIPYLMVPSYIALFWTYRQVREYGMGSGGAPLFEQLGISIPGFIQSIFFYAGLLVFFIFPFYIGVLMAASFDPGFGDPARWPAWLKLVTAIILLVFVVFTWLCLASERDKEKKMPENRKKVYLRYVLPASALLLGESAASLSELIHVAWKDSGAETLLALTVFIPLRFILMRTVGAWKPGIFTFIIASIFSVISMMMR